LLNWWDWCVFPWIITNLVVIPTWQSSLS
jgi:hypothetical protein